MAYKPANDPTLYTAKPLYNDNILKFWNWFDSVWNCNDWMTWHKALTVAYGKDKAANLFIKEWDNMATGSSAIDCRTFNTTFRAYMKSVGLLDALYSGLGVIAKPIGGAIEIADNVGSGITGASKVLRIALPIIMVLVIVFAVMYATKMAKQVKK